MATPEKTVSFEIHTEVTSASFNDLLIFIYQNYIFPLHKYFANVRQWNLYGRDILAFTFIDPKGEWYVDVEIEAGNPVHIRMTPSNATVPKTALNRIKDDLIINIQLFEEKVRRTTIYFAWVKNEEIMLEKAPQKRRKIASQIFLGNMLLFFMIFIALSYMAFLVFNIYTPIVLVLSQLVMFLFSDKIMKRVGDWPITPENPSVYILQYHIPPQEFSSFRRRYTRDVLLQMKKEIYRRTLAVGKPIDCQTVQEVFFEYGINCRAENLSTKTVNVYHLVKEVAERFNIPAPKIVISNVIIPNAGATGPSPSHGLVLITTGLLVQLEDDEILSVLGHEISHLKRRDPLALFALTSTEYLLRVYVLLPFLFYFGFFYFFFALSGVYFIAKFFEARADLESAVKIGRPKVLATALRKIGFRKIRLERIRGSRIGNWLGMDPHPPVSFRISRLEALENPSEIRHPFIRSMIDCINGLLKG